MTSGSETIRQWICRLDYLARGWHYPARYSAADLQLTREVHLGNGQEFSRAVEADVMAVMQGKATSKEDAIQEIFPGGKIQWPASVISNIDPTEHFRWWGKDFIYPPLHLRLVHDALLYPGAGFRIEENSHIIGEARDAANRLVPESMARLNYGYCLRQDVAARLRKDAVTLPGIHLFYGKLILNYGHYLIDSLNRAWSTLQMPGPFKSCVPVIDTGGMRLTAGSLRSLWPWVDYGYKRSGIDLRRAIILARPLIVEKLVVPTPSFRIGDDYEYIHPAQSMAWNAIAGPAGTNPSRKIYLSRRRYRLGKKQRRPLENEKELEDFLKSAGFEIIYPELLSLEQQMEIYRNTRVMCSLAGSNIFNCAFMPTGGTVINIRPLSKSLTPRLVQSIGMIREHRMIYFFSSEEIGNYDSESPWSLEMGAFTEFFRKLNIDS